MAVPISWRRKSGNLINFASIGEKLYHIYVSDIEQLTKKITDFRDKRDWKQFHNPKDKEISDKEGQGEP